ncbi:hypothetical protein UK23_32380 [Lentzea aerocolonigenes]|uniref:Elongation factor EFG domain-containing protein n=1 Tax=Lentzea aerocolonigenes TaxID=68170 RepID=A0A0F0GK15_LENAE|nr:hypothetical protein UK23_32380 [Lentzea aerocolonigenes]
MLQLLSRRRGLPKVPAQRGAVCVVEGDIPAAQVHALGQQLPGLTRGEGVLESEFDHYAPITAGPVPQRTRTDHNPLNRKEYLKHVVRRT